MITDAHLETLYSRIEIGDLVSDYCHGVDKHDLERFARIWHDDAIWEIGPPFGDFTGRDSICSALVDHIWPAWRETHHWTTNLVLEFDDPNHARGVCDVNCNGANPDGVMQVVAATYRDRFERRDGRWAIAVRRVDMFYFNQLPGVYPSPPSY